ncbi:Uncharacterised protein [Candidatus Bilamarchaeum dharawalense]|uniref:Cardiolipin synthase N-terminal domain-containing protein n=1 Tax=Candidatus Bilamarchaeum dharawalense TaxID=2885759 RepID=A0A5E4LQK4_9ARCH|nr:Uncharacterised protein [Candidatus Bilamarchaeum dharawalense]
MDLGAFMDKKYIKWTLICSVALLLIAILLAVIYIITPVILTVIMGQNVCDPVYGSTGTLTQSLTNLCNTSRSLIGMITMVAIIIAGFVMFLFTILVLIDLVTNPNLDNKVVWIVGVLFLGLLAAILYYQFVKKKEN